MRWPWQDLLDVTNCALELANRGPSTLDQIGHQMGLTREGVRVIEVRAMQKLRPIPEWQQVLEEETPDVHIYGSHRAAEGE